MVRPDRQAPAPPAVTRAPVVESWLVLPCVGNCQLAAETRLRDDRRREGCKSAAHHTPHH